MNPAERYRQTHPTVKLHGKPAPQPTLSTFRKIQLALSIQKHMKNLNFASWKTGLSGLIVLAATIVPTIWPEYSALMVQIVGIATSLGLLVARDNNVTSKEAGAK